MEKLEEMFEIQKRLQQRLGTWMKINSDASNIEKNRQQFANQIFLAMFEETVEIMRETAYKNPEYVEFGWKKGQTLNREKILKEIVDLWHFMINICLVYDFSSEDFYNCYMEKNKENHIRQDNNY